MNNAVGVIFEYEHGSGGNIMNVSFRVGIMHEYEQIKCYITRL